MAEGGASLSSGSVIFDNYCEICIDDGRQLEAHGFCVDCGEYLCVSCYSGHKTTRFTKHHVQQDKTSMPNDSPLSPDRKDNDIATKCGKHSGEPVKYYCTSHRAFDCSTCFAEDQRGCKRIESIAKDSETRRVEDVRPPSSASPKTMTVTNKAEIDVTSVGDKKKGGWIPGSAVMNDNKLIISDHTNNKLKLIDTKSNKLTATLQLSTGPWDVAAINNHQAVVSLPDRKQILIVTVTDTLSKEREITVSGRCRGVAYCRDMLLLANMDTLRLEFMDLCGTVVRTIEMDTVGNGLFVNVSYVCFSKDGNMIFMSDNNSNTVTSLTLSGQVKAVYKNKTLLYPGKICTDHHGNVYVCGVNSRNVHMMTADCRSVRVILTEADGLDSFVWSISHCQDTNRLFIGMQKNKVQRYQLS